MEAQKSPQAQPDTQTPLNQPSQPNPITLRAIAGGVGNPNDHVGNPSDHTSASAQQQGIAGEQGIAGRADWGRADDGWPIWPPPLPEIRAAMEAVLATNQWGNYRTDVHDQLSETLKTRFEAEEVRLCSSGTMAVELALRAIGVKPGDGVVLAAYDYPGNFRTVELLGARPVLCDVVEGGVTMCPESLELLGKEKKSSTKNVVAVLVSHLHGHLADMPAIYELCDRFGWKLVEDICQAPGAGWHSPDSVSASRTLGAEQPSINSQAPAMRRAGTFADIAAMSFGGSKLLSAGNGGAVLMRSNGSATKLAAKLTAWCDRPSDTVPLSALQAAVLLPQLSWLDSMNVIRARSAKALQQLDWSFLGGRKLREIPDEVVPAHYKFAIEVEADADRGLALKQLRDLGMPAGEGFRGTHGTSDRRSDKPVGLERSRQRSERLIAIDHRLLLDPDSSRSLQIASGVLTD